MVSGQTIDCQQSTLEAFFYDKKNTFLIRNATINKKKEGESPKKPCICKEKNSTNNLYWANNGKQTDKIKTK